MQTVTDQQLTMMLRTDDGRPNLPVLKALVKAGVVTRIRHVGPGGQWVEREFLPRADCIASL